jgi:hypothetical protein
VSGFVAMMVGKGSVKGVNCYEVVFEVVDSMPEGESRIVHGRPKYRGIESPDSDGRYGHAWVECRGLVFDYSHNNSFVIDVDRYYSIGEIDPKEVKKYTLVEARRLAVTTETWGPWD